jgi:thioredoxin reductase (NADPH)
MEYKTRCLIYAARANMSPIMVCGDTPGGQLMTTTDVENFPGFIKIQGPELMDIMQQHAKAYGTEIINDFIIDADFTKRPFVCKDRAGNNYIAESVIICTGAEAKWLGIPSEDEYKGFGVSGCATCDGFFFRNKVVAVVGGGNTAITEALYLTNHASKVYVIHRRDSLRSEKVLQDRLLNHPKIEMLWNCTVDEILGEKDNFGKAVNGVRLKSTLDGNLSELKLDGVFIAIGHKPNTELFKGKLEMDEEGYIITKAGTPITSIEGVYAAGDVQDKVYKQAITSAGVGCAAALEAEAFVNS